MHIDKCKSDAGLILSTNTENCKGVIIDKDPITGEPLGASCCDRTAELQTTLRVPSGNRFIALEVPAQGTIGARSVTVDVVELVNLLKSNGHCMLEFEGGCKFNLTPTQLIKINEGYKQATGLNPGLKYKETCKRG